MAKDAADEIKLKDQEMIKKIMPAIEKAIKTVAKEGNIQYLLRYMIRFTSAKMHNTDTKGDRGIE